MDIEAAGEASTSESQSSIRQSRHMINIYLTDSVEEVIIDFLRNQEKNKNQQEVQGKYKESMHVGEVCKHPQTVSEGVQDLV